MPEMPPFRLEAAYPPRLRQPLTMALLAFCPQMPPAAHPALMLPVLRQFSIVPLFWPQTPPAVLPEAVTSAALRHRRMTPLFCPQMPPAV